MGPILAQQMISTGVAMADLFPLARLQSSNATAHGSSQQWTRGLRHFQQTDVQFIAVQRGNVPRTRQVTTLAKTFHSELFNQQPKPSQPHKLRKHIHGSREILIPTLRSIPTSQTAIKASTGAAETIKLDIPQPVLVAGAGGGVGQLVVAALLERNCAVKALLRNLDKGRALFTGDHGGQLDLVAADLRKEEGLRDILEGVASVVICTGTTAFPSSRWAGGNGPEPTDVDGTRNLLAALPSSVKRIVYVSSVGVTRYDQLPYSILNLFGVLRCKKLAEEMVEACGIPYTIIRPGRLTDGPYTSYDLNTLLKATAGTRRAAVVAKGDALTGEASRVLVAEACVQALGLKETEGQAYCVNSVEGEGPGKDTKQWAAIFEAA